MITIPLEAFAKKLNIKLTKDNYTITSICWAKPRVESSLNNKYHYEYISGDDLFDTHYTPPTVELELLYYDQKDYMPRAIKIERVAQDNENFLDTTLALINDIPWYLSAQ